MEIKTTYTVEGKTFDTEQEAMDYSYFLERKGKVKELIKDLFKETSNFYGHGPEGIAEKIVNNPEIFQEALDIVEGK